jgi:hypothetical protein
MTLPTFPFIFSLRRARFAICTILSAVMLTSPACLTAQAPDTARAAAIDAANARAAELFRALSEAKSDGARDQAISALHAMARSKAPEEHEAIAHYGLTAFMTSADAKKQEDFTAHRAILAKVIPLMIGTLTGDVQDKAWWVLINVQDTSPPPKRALWEKWWREKGKALYAPAPGSAVPAPAPAPPAPPQVPTLRPPKDTVKK